MKEVIKAEVKKGILKYSRTIGLEGTPYVNEWVWRGFERVRKSWYVDEHEHSWLMEYVND